jgi:hypothetical protein
LKKLKLKNMKIKITVNVKPSPRLSRFVSDPVKANEMFEKLKSL